MLTSIEKLSRRLIEITGAGFTINVSQVNGSPDYRHYYVTYYLTLPIGQIEQKTCSARDTLERALEYAIERVSKDWSELCKATDWRRAKELPCKPS